MWLDAAHSAASLRLDDQSFKDAGRVHRGCAHAPLAAKAGGACGHTIDDSIVAHTLGCNRLSDLVQSGNDDTAEVLRELIGCLGYSSSREGWYSRLTPRTPTRSLAETSTATCGWDPAMC
jgi:hypothetical protein